MLTSILGVVDVVEVRGVAASADAVPRLLFEVAHGADQRSHYDDWMQRLVGPFPEGLVDFFHANTDEGAWDIACATAQSFVARRPTEVVRLLRCLIPRTFIDCNRVLDGDASAHGGDVTAGLPVYVDHPEDVRLLQQHHAQYTAVVDAALAEVVAAGGFAVLPHTYAPREVGIASVGRDIVSQMHRVWGPALVETWPLRPDVDLITLDGDRVRQCPLGVVEPLIEGFATLGWVAQECGTYWLHPATRAAALSARYPGRLICFEVRRDLVMQDWVPFSPCRPNEPVVAKVAEVLADVLVGQLP